MKTKDIVWYGFMTLATSAILFGLYVEWLKYQWLIENLARIK